LKLHEYAITGYTNKTNAQAHSVMYLYY